MSTRSVRPVQGALLLALSALLFACMGVVIREASATVNNENIVFFRNLVGVVFFLPLLLVKGLRPFKTQRLKSHLMRTSYGLAAMYCFFLCDCSPAAGRCNGFYLLSTRVYPAALLIFG